MASGSPLFSAACLTVCKKKKKLGARASPCLSIFFFSPYSRDKLFCLLQAARPAPLIHVSRTGAFFSAVCGCCLLQIVKSLACEIVIRRYIKRLFMLLSNVCNCSDVGCRALHRPKIKVEVTVKCKSIRSTQPHLVLILLQCSPKAGEFATSACFSQ